tara:strand:+ start:164 stop:1777 length:1614 start_codon:yes stop_codon:yes gene_type:complete
MLTTESLDHFGLVAAILRKLNVIERIDAMLPVSSSKGSKVSHGERVAAMIINGLGFVDQPLYLSPQFFENKPLDLLFSRPMEAAWFNDDALGRTLDAIYEYGSTKLLAQLAHELAIEFKLYERVIRMDSTSLTLYGDYENEGFSEYAMVPDYGYSKQHRPDLKQVILTVAMSGPANLPIWFECASGNTSDKSNFPRVLERMRAFHQALEDAEDILYVADSALYAKGELDNAQWLWLTRVPNTVKCVQQSRAHTYPTTEWTRANAPDYSFQWIKSPKGAKGQKWLLVHSQKSAVKQTQTLERQIAKAYDKAQHEAAALGRGSYACVEDAARAAKKLSRGLKYHEADWSYTAIEKFDKKGRPRQGQPPDRTEYKVTLRSLSEDESKVAPYRQAVGRFVLATNDASLDAEAMLRIYKGQTTLEHGFGLIKSDRFQLDHVFLKTPSRIDALMMVMTLCLLTYNIGQHHLRDELIKQDVFLPDQKNNPTQTPTLRWIFHLMIGVHVAYKHGELLGVVNLHEVRVSIIQLFGKEAEEIYRINR